MADLVDTNVWVPLSVPAHPHHLRARHYWEQEAGAEQAFCRVTSLALLRLLSDERVFRDNALDSEGTWHVLRRWLSTPGVFYLEEPSGLDELLSHWSTELDVRGPGWTDAYLAALAIASGTRLVSFDSDFARYPGLSWLHLEA